MPTYNPSLRTVIFILALVGTVSFTTSSAQSDFGLEESLDNLNTSNRDLAISTLDSLWVSFNHDLDTSSLQFSRNVAKKYRGLNAHHKSVIVYESLLDLAIRLNDTALICESEYYQGLGYRNMGLFNEALEHLFHTLSLEETSDQSEWTRVSLIQIGIIKKEQGLLHESIEHFERALEIARASDNITGIASVLNNIGSAYKLLGEYQLAKEYLQEAIELNKSDGNLKYLSYNYNTLANVYEETNDLENALTYQNKSIEYKRQLNDNASLSVSYLNKAIILNKMSRTNEAFELLEKSLEMSKRYEQASLTPHIYEELGKAYFSADQPEKAYEYVVASSNYQDSLNEADKKALISEMEAFYNQRKVESENSTLKKTLESGATEIKKRETLLFSLFTIIGILLILVSAYIIANRKRVFEAKAYKDQFEALQARSTKIQDQSQRIEMSTSRLEQLKNDNELCLTTLRSDVRGLVSALNALLGVIQKSNQDSQLNEKIALLAFSSENLMWLIENILEFESDLSQMKSTSQTLDVKEELETICSNFQQLFDDKGVDFIVQVQIKESSRIASIDRLHQVTFSLLDSAFKLTQEGFVKFDVEEHGGSINLNLECSNPEIPAGFLKRVFNRFYLTSEENYKILGGSGLNLYMINRIAEHNNWSFETTQPPERLQFKLRLPLKIPTPAESM